MTSKQAEEIIKIISDHIEVIKQLVVGSGKPSQAVMSRLKINKETADLITTAFKYGKVVNGRLNISNDEISELIKNTKLTVTQTKALEHIKISTGQHITGLGTKISGAVIPALAASGISQLQGVRTIVANGIMDSSSQYTVVQGLRDITADWERDWHRVAHTEMWNAKLQGELMETIENLTANDESIDDAIVFKRPSPMACNQCKKLYLENDGKTPKLFKLSEMLSYGNNVGLKMSEWKPVYYTAHPNCECIASIMPKGGKFDESGSIVFSD